VANVPPYGSAALVSQGLSLKMLKTTNGNARELGSDLRPRERNKLDKARRIKTAARELFLEQGYDNATTREIARRADVGLGTLFSYASDKRDLLFLIYNDIQEELTRKAFATPPAERAFLRQVMASFAVYYRFFASEPEFMRYVLRELAFYSSGRQADRFQIGREAIISGIERLVRSAKKRRVLRTHTKDRVIAQLMFGVYQAEIRRWLTGGTPQPAAGLAKLRTMLRIVIEGLKPGPGAV
jgi:AcrR family transcriptional regulator